MTGFFSKSCRIRGLIKLLLAGACCWAHLGTYAIVDANSENNTSPPPDGAPWANVGTVNGASGIYIGAGWVLTAGHVGGGDINLLGTDYPWDGTLHWLTNSDGSFADGIVLRLRTVPALPRVPLVSSTPPAVSQVDMIGFGFRSGSAQTNFSLGTTGFYWSSASGIKSWGNNKLDPAPPVTVYDGFTNVIAFSTTFDGPPAPLQTSDECQAGNGDSGGGVFYQNGSQWELAEMIVAIDEPLTNRPFNSAVYTDQTYALDIATYRDQIVTWLESTIPRLSIVPSGTNIQLGWVDTGVSYQLQSTASLTVEKWTPLAATVSLTNGQFNAQTPITPDPRFFRLQKQ